MSKPAKEKEVAKPIEGATDDPSEERLLDLIKAREALSGERGGEQLMPGLTQEKHISEMRKRGATEDYIAFIYDSVERKFK